jgi:hypothetical protein
MTAPLDAKKLTLNLVEESDVIFEGGLLKLNRGEGR